MTPANRRAPVSDLAAPVPDAARADPVMAAPARMAPVVRRASRLDFVGDLDAVIALVGVATDAASAMLPAGLRLAPQDLAPDSQHPLLFVLGRQRNVRFALWRGGIDYFEFILVVPFVEHDPSGAERAGPFAYLPRLFLDRRLPTIGGRLLLAYAKRRALISTTDETYRIASVSTGELLLSARFREMAQTVGGLPPTALREVLGLPVISRRTRGGWRYSVADFALEQAQIAPIAVDFAIERPFVPGLPTGAFAIGGESGQAFRLRTSWRLSGPLARRSPPRHPGLDNRPQKR
jgi:hypothetical protein